MEFEKFKESLASEARDENEKLKKEIESLKQKNRELSNKLKYSKSENEKLNKAISALTERCHIFTSGSLCERCTLSPKLCKHHILHGIVPEQDMDMIEKHLIGFCEDIVKSHKDDKL